MEKKTNVLFVRALQSVGPDVLFLWIKIDIVIAGNGVYEQAQELGLKVRVIESDGTELIAIKRTDLSTKDEKRKLLALADNRASDSSQFNFAAIVEDFCLEELNDWKYGLTI